MGVRGGLGEAPGALREVILGEKVVFGNLHAVEAPTVLFGTLGKGKVATMPRNDTFLKLENCHAATGTGNWPRMGRLYFLSLIHI